MTRRPMTRRAGLLVAAGVVVVAAVAVVVGVLLTRSSSTAPTPVPAFVAGDHTVRIVAEATSRNVGPTVLSVDGQRVQVALDSGWTAAGTTRLMLAGPDQGASAAYVVLAPGQSTHSGTATLTVLAVYNRPGDITVDARVTLS